jgi:hypothetical protein
LAAVRCKHRVEEESCQIDDADIRQADVLRSHVALRLKQWTLSQPPDTTSNPADDFHIALRAVVEQYRSGVPMLPEADRKNLEDLLSLLDRFRTRTLTRGEAATMVDLLNQIAA